MDRTTTTTSAVILCVVLGTVPVAAEFSQVKPLAKFTKGGVVFLIEQAELAMLPPHPRPIMSPGNSALPQGPVLALTMAIVNKRDTLKMDIPCPLVFHMSDEYGNGYRMISSTPDGGSAAGEASCPVRTLYPNHKMRETIYFEPPLQTSRLLEISTDAGFLGLIGDISVLLPTEKIGQARLCPGHRIPEDKDLTILSPSEGATVRPGKAVALRIALADDLDRPTQILVISPNYTYEDRRLIGRYNLRVPQCQPPGPLTVVVMASWERGDGSVTISQSVTLSVLGRGDDGCPPDAGMTSTP